MQQVPQRQYLLMLNFLHSLFHIDAVAGVMIALVGFIGTLVWLFAHTYMKGDRHYARFLAELPLLCLSVMVMLAADQLLLFFFAWCASNTLLIKMMVHKPQWRAARASGWLTAKNFLLAGLCLAVAFFLMYRLTGQSSIQAIIKQTEVNGLNMQLALVLMLLAAMMQSAIWPFHRWLLSSLNSPTPVSAIMHAGLINGGGFLLVRFAPLYLNEHGSLQLIFLIGLFTAVIGTLWKLLQQDVKRMLACSTMGQMGFMMLQCGLGLFPAAVAHLCWHGVFKAYLFLGSGSAAQVKSIKPQPLTLSAFALALLCGGAGSYSFALNSNKSGLGMDTTWVLLGVAFIAIAQFALVMLEVKPWRNLWFSVPLSCIAGALYGNSIKLIEHWLMPLSLAVPQPLNAIYLIGSAILLFAWLVMVLTRNAKLSPWLSKLWLRCYVSQLNASQPHPKTITTQRNHYDY